MKLIKLTSHNDDKPIYINIDKIDYFYEGVISKMRSNVIIDEKFTKLGHNGSVSEVKETPEEIIVKIKMIKNANSTRTI
jgi:hypothetical protein